LKSGFLSRPWMNFFEVLDLGGPGTRQECL